MAECPSGRYLDELVTASGLTVKSPTTSSEAVLWDWSGSESDYADWDSLANTLLARLERTWLQFKAWPGTSTMSTDAWNALVEQLNSVRQRYAKLRKPWTSSASAWGTTEWTWGIAVPDVAWDATSDITALVGLLVDAQCLRQRLDETLTSLGGTPDLPSDTGHVAPTPVAPGSMGVLAKLGLAVGGIAVITGAIALARKVGKP